MGYRRLERRIPLAGNGPRGLAVVGNTAYAAEYFSDTLGAVDLVAAAAAAAAAVLALLLAVGVAHADELGGAYDQRLAIRCGGCWVPTH